MTQKERFLAALRLETPDVVPVSPLIHSRYAHARLGRSDWRAVFELHHEIGSCHYRGPIGVGIQTEMPEGWKHSSEVLPNEGDLSLREAKELYGDEVCVMGNFDSVILAHGSVEEARAEAKRCLDEAMEGGAYIMGTGDEVPADTRFENLKAMVDVVEEFGRY